MPQIANGSLSLDNVRKYDSFKRLQKWCRQDNCSQHLKFCHPASAFIYSTVKHRVVLFFSEALHFVIDFRSSDKDYEQQRPEARRLRDSKQQLHILFHTLMHATFK